MLGFSQSSLISVSLTCTSQFYSSRNCKTRATLHLISAYFCLLYLLSSPHHRQKVFFNFEWNKLHWLFKNKISQNLSIFLFFLYLSFRAYYIKNQQDATLAVLFISHCKNYSTRFGRFLRPSSGVLKTTVFSIPDDGRRRRPKHIE